MAAVGVDNSTDALPDSAKTEDSKVQTAEDDSEDFVDPLQPLKSNPVFTEAPPEWSVVIRNAVTPWNFQVTDYRQSKNLERMEDAMTVWYSNYEKTNDKITFEDLQLGGHYAVQHVSGGDVKWQRGEIVKPFAKGLPITVRLVDHGAFHHTTPDKIFPLRKCYSILPIQAVEATLIATEGPKSPNRQFTPEECHKFYQRVEGKDFYAYVMNSVESLQRGEKLKLILVDTSQDRNRYVHEEFSLKLDTS